jgi:O-antigen/teichoic acid export membrane protein
MPTKFLKILDKVTPGATRSLGWEVILTVLSFPASILVNRTLGAEDRGLLSLVLLIPFTVITLGTCQWERLVKGLITSNKISSKEAWHRTIYYTFWLSLVFIPLGILACLAYAQLTLPNRLLGVFFSFSFPVIMLSTTLSSIFVAAGSLDGQYLMRVGYQCSYIFLVFALTLFGWLSVSSLVVTTFIIWLISLLIGLFKQPKILKGTEVSEKPPFLPLLQSFLPYAFECFSLNADTWAFSIFGSLLTLGHYTGISGLMQPIGLVSNALVNGSTAHLDWTKPLLVRRYLIKTLVTMTFMLVLLTIGGMLVGTNLLGFILGRSFEGGQWMIPLIAGIVVSKSVATQFHFALQLSGQENAYLFVQTLDSIMRIGVVLLLGWKFSEIGILIGCISSSIFKCAACSYFLATAKVKTA